MKRPFFHFPALTISTALLTVSVSSLAGCYALKETKPRPTVISGFSSPESVIPDPAGGRFFVSDVGEKLLPSVKDSDGYIAEVSPDGRVLNKKFLPKDPKDGVLDAPKGMAIVGRTLYVTDIDRVVGFDIDTREKAFEMDLSAEKTSFLNDPAVIDDSTLAVSATDVGRVYAIRLGDTPSYSVIAENIPGANGLWYDGDNKRLFVASFGDGTSFNGALGVIDFRNGAAAYRPLTERLGALDGVALLKDGRVIFSDWVSMDKPGLLRAYDMKTGALTVITLSEDVRGPADFYYDGKTGKLWLPRMLEGKVTVEEIR